MNVILFGATGMIGQGVLRECLLDPEVKKVLSIVRTPSGTPVDPKVTELVHKDFYDFSALAPQLAGYDACLFCLGVSSAGMKEDAYTRITYDLTLAAAQALVQHSDLTFLYISGAGTDGSERGGSMWARVKGKTENALLQMPFKAAYMFRPGFIQPRNGIKSKTTMYRIIYAILGPLYFLLKGLSGFVTSTDRVGKVMLSVAKHGADKRVLENRDINDLAKTL